MPRKRRKILRVLVEEIRAGDNLNPATPLKVLGAGSVTFEDVKLILKSRRYGDTSCRSGVLLNVPATIPATALTWESLYRVFHLMFVGEGELRAYRFYVCLDDLLNASFVAPLSNKYIHGIRDLDGLVHFIQAFSLYIARTLKTPKKVELYRRLVLARRLETSILETVRAWLKEVDSGGTGEGD